MKNYTRLFLAGIVLFTFTTSCGTITKSSKAEVRFNSSPAGAAIVFNGVEIGKTPAALKLDRKTGHVLTFKLDGYKDVNVEVKQSFDFPTTILGNIIFGGLIGIIVDLGSGAAYSLTPADVEANFEKLTAFSGKKSKKGEYTVIMMTQAEWDVLRSK